MAGIYGFLFKENNSNKIYNSFFNSSFFGIVKNEVNYKENIFGRCVLAKFSDDRFFYEDESFIICFEGINYSSIKTPLNFIENYKKEGISFITNLSGVFSGFFHSKKENTIHIFNDPLGSKSIFYFFDANYGFAFSSEMHVLSKVLRENSINFNFNVDGIYSLSLYGQLFDEQTVVEEINRLTYGSIISYDIINRKVSKKKYFRLDKTIDKTITKQDATQKIDVLMLDAIEQEWSKDVNNKYSNHLTLISGGMDSRVNALLASEIGYNNINSYTYGDPRSSDIKIAGKIAKDHFYSHVQSNLTSGNYLCNNILENYIKPTDGLVIYTPTATMFHSLMKINCNNSGVLHTGQIGDVVFGSFIRENFDILKNKDQIGLTGFVKHKNILNKITSLESILNRYKNEDYELYSYEQRQINGTLMGDRLASNFIDHVSPFYNLDLIKFMLSLPTEYKKNQKIYFDWLQEYHPDTLKYKWEKIGRKPNSNINLKYGAIYKKYTNGGKKFFNLRYDSMNPIANWMASNSSMGKKLLEIFNENIEKVKSKEIQSDLRLIYNDDVFEYRNKFSVITVLLSLKLHFGW